MSSLPQTIQPPNIDIAFQTVINQAKEIVFVKDINGRFIFMNEAGIQCLKLPSLEDIVGKDSAELFGATIGFECWESEYRVLTSGKPHTSQTLFPGLAGKLQITKFPYTSSENKVLGVVGVGHIIGENEVKSSGLLSLTPPIIDDHKLARKPIVAPQHLLQESRVPEMTSSSLVEQDTVNLSRALLSLQAAITAVASSLDMARILDTFVWEMINLLEAGECFVFHLNPDDDSIFSHITFPKQNKHTEKQTYKLADYSLFKKTLDERCAQQMANDQLGSVFPEYRRLFKGDIESILVLPLIFHDQLIGVTAVIERVKPRIFTDQEVSLAQLLVSQAASSIVNARLYMELDAANKALTVSNEELDAFSHTVAHDLKSPLGLIIGFSDIIMKEGDSISQSDLHEFLQIIVNNGRKMTSIINGLLTLASVRQGEIDTEPLSMAQYVIESKIRLIPLIEKYQAEIVIQEDLPTAWGYGTWIEEVWANYLSNALKYGGRPPRIQVGATKQKDNMIRFWVKDNGEGLTLEQQSQLFTPFTRLNQAAIEGHGLGLSIVQRIVKKLGGEVGVDSTPGQGSTFFFTLPDHKI